ncbi:MAG: uncharacterized protein K0R25_657 [Rickettsiaceae bacterium]|jgi:hypothetical protein|nr:uncharacterized protein [Rickettsiaceae bacterium]
MLKKTISTLLFLLAFQASVLAEEFQGKFADWNVFAVDFGSKKICYMMSLPVKKDGNYYRRGEPYFLIVNSNDNIDEITISSGYNYKNNSEVELSFGSKKFNALTYKTLSWANNKTDDIEIIKEMRRSLDVLVLGVNKNNQYSIDTYSLIGFNQAFGKMKEACRS